MGLLRLIHFSKKPLDSVKSVSVKIQKIDTKPVGLWFSVEGNGDGWKNWCEAESYNLDNLLYKNQIELESDANLLILSSIVAIDSFHERFKASLPGMEKYFSDYIDWQRVAIEYQGIIITPYIWERRLDGKAHSWYHGWDCASGCIWDSKAIKNIITMRTDELESGEHISPDIQDEGDSRIEER